MSILKGSGRTNGEKRKKLFDRISPNHLFTHTSIFSDPIGADKLDSYTVEHIKKQYSTYFKNWVEEDARKFILQEKQKP